MQELPHQHYRAIVKRSQDAICLLSPDGVILYANPASKRVLGCSPEEIIGQNCFDVVLPAEPPEALIHLAELIADPARSRSVQLRMTRKDGVMICAPVRGQCAGRVPVETVHRGEVRKEGEIRAGTGQHSVGWVKPSGGPYLRWSRALLAPEGKRIRASPKCLKLLLKAIAHSIFAAFPNPNSVDTAARR